MWIASIGNWTVRLVASGVEDRLPMEVRRRSIISDRLSDLEPREGRGLQYGMLYLLSVMFVFGYFFLAPTATTASGS